MEQGWSTIFHTAECFLKKQLYCKAVNMNTNVSQPGQRSRLSCLGRVNGLMGRLKLFGWLMIHWHHLVVESSINISSFQQLGPLLMKAETDARASSPWNADHQNLGSISFYLFCPIGHFLLCLWTGPRVSWSHNDYLLLIIICYNIQHSFLWPGVGVDVS